MEQSIMKVIELQPALRGSFIEDLLLAYQTGAEGMEAPARNGDSVDLDAMNPIEKALWGLSKQYADAEAGFVGRFRQEGVEGQAIESSEREQMLSQLQMVRTRFQIAQQLFWNSVKRRFTDQLKPGFNHLGIAGSDRIIMHASNRA